MKYSLRLQAVIEDLAEPFGGARNVGIDPDRDEQDLGIAVLDDGWRSPEFYWGLTT